MTEHRYDDMLNTARESLEYWAETAIIDFTEEIVRLMDETGMNRADLARRIGSSQPYITKLLGGNANFTITTMTKLARAFDKVVRIHLAPDRVMVQWDDKPITTDSTTSVFIQFEPNTRVDNIKVFTKSYSTDIPALHDVAALV